MIVWRETQRKNWKPALRAQERIRNNLRLKEDLLIAEIHVAGQPQAKINGSKCFGFGMNTKRSI